MNRALPERIFVSGFMGAGKSTIGKLLAKKLNLAFYDLDTCIENKANQSIPEIFDKEDEAGFRKKEKVALLDVIRSKKGVIALGGGALQNQHLVDHVKVNGMLVLVDTPIEVIIERISGDENRPLLQDDCGNMKPEAVLKEELQALYKQRYPFYEQAEVTVKTNEYGTAELLTDELVKKIRYHVALH